MSAPNGEGDNRLAEEILVPSTDPEKKEGGKGKENGDVKGKGKGDEKEQSDISEEDLQLQAELEMLVERLKESDTSLYLPALESLRTLIRTSTSSMTSVPKPLKFLRPHYDEMGGILESWNQDLKEQRSLLASILSVLAMTYSDTGKRDTLTYRLRSGTTEDPGLWGHEYVRHLAAELGEEWNSYYASLVEEPSTTTAVVSSNGDGDAAAAGGSTEKEKEDTGRKYSQDQLRSLALELVDFFLKHNGEADAVDLCLELECIGQLAGKVDEKSYERVCRYMVQCVPLLVPPDDRSFLETAAEIYAKNDRYSEALALAVQMGDRGLVRKYFDAPRNPVMKKQLAYFLARSLVPLSWVHTAEGTEQEGDGPCPEQPEDILACLGSVKFSSHFKAFGKAVGVEDPRNPEDIYKTHLEPTRAASVDTARTNLASTFVNAFVNAGFGNDKLMVGAAEGQSWIYKNKAEGMMSSTASIGLSMLWDSEAGIDHIDKYSYSSEEHIKAGAFLAMGILHSGVRPDPDVAFALLEEHVDSKSTQLKVAAINGIAMAYAGSQRRDVMEKLLPYVADETNSMEVASMAALALGFVFVGSGDGEIASTVLQTLMEREEAQLESEWTVFMGLALGLIFLATQDASDATIETLRAIEHPMAETAVCLVDVCSYAGTGNVLKIQDMLHICSEHASTKAKKTAAATAAAPANGDANATAAAPGEDVNMFETAQAANAGAGPGAGRNEPVDLESLSALLGGAAPGAAGAGSAGAAGAAGSTSSPTDSATAGAAAVNGAAGNGSNTTADPIVASGSGAASDETMDDAEAEGDADAAAAAAGEPKPLKHQAVATLGIALIAMGEDIGSEMALRQFQHLMTYGDQPIRAAIPLALGLLSASNPQLSILDTLSKYSHDSDLHVAQNAIFAMGLVGAGTNNARLAQMLRGLAGYYAKEGETLFMVRIAQGLVHMGKGTIGLNPFYHDRQVMHRPAVAGLLAVLVSFTDSKSFVLGKHHWMLFWLVTAMYPQFLITLDEELEEKAVTVRVGQAVNTVGLAGTRHGISGFQTHQTPVRIGTGERAELGTNEFFPYQTVLENFVVLKKNEAYDAED